MKNCVKCLNTKSTLLFPKRGNECKECVSVYMAVYREDNKDRISQLKKAWKLNNSEHVKAKDKAYGLLHSDLKAQAGLKWRIANPELNKQHKAKYVKNNGVSVKLSKRTWVINNPDKLREKDARRRAAKLQRIPKWTTETDLWMVQEIYELSVLRTKLTGILWHVDHIIPLQGGSVSGLHAPFNMQVIPAIENMRKSNKYEF